VAQKTKVKGLQAQKHKVTANIFFNKSQYEIATEVARYCEQSIEVMCAEDCFDCIGAMLENMDFRGYFNAAKVWTSDVEFEMPSNASQPVDPVKVSITLDLSSRQYDVLQWFLACYRQSFEEYANYACKDMIRATLESQIGFPRGFIPSDLAEGLHDRWLAECPEFRL
jgi:hypothetical protein